MNEDLNRVVQVDLEKEMKESYLAYSMSVIVGPRAAGRTRRTKAGTPSDFVYHV